MTERLLTARVVAEQLDVSTETVLRWIRRGQLPGGPTTRRRHPDRRGSARRVAGRQGDVCGAGIVGRLAAFEAGQQTNLGENPARNR